ncbi:MAG TPA: carboxypeptidase-like regulatory domain-containing protein, partial [Terriglobia bacterium]|nr:carboxypeptidase-like regulatory domain-containing protein [Terriglobia bacterium]
MARKGIHGAKVECRKPNVLAQPAAVLDIGFSALRAKIARVNHASIALVALLLAQGAIPTGRGAIAGQILHEDNTPAAGVRVAAIAGDSSDAMAIVALTETDANGRYRLEDVPAGLHFLAAGPLRALTYFPGVVTLAEAQAIMVAANSFQEGRDFRLSNRSINPDVARLDVSSPGSLNVRGRFLVEGGGPIPKSVILKHSPAGVSFAPASTETPIIADSGGAFQATITGVNGGRIVLNGVEPSAYSVSAVMFGSDDALTHRATVVTGRELVVTFKSAGVQVTGRI